jgi:dTDP-glucose pyrophosphorylase
MKATGTPKSAYEGVILAAGSGTRMMALSDKYPKPLLPIFNKPLIQYQIELMRSLGIRDITILIGHRGYQITREFGDGSALGVNLNYVEQGKMLGIAHAVGTLEPHINRPFLLFLGDIYFLPSEMQQMFSLFEQHQLGAVLATKEEPDVEAIKRNYSVHLNDEGLVTRVIEKPRHTTSRLKGVGIYLFDLTIFDAIRRTPRTAMRDEYEITDAIQVMIADGYPVRAANAVLDDINMSTPHDLLDLNLRLLKEMTENNYVGDDCHIHPQAAIRNSIIGSRVSITQPISVVNSVIFSNTTLDSAAMVENSIVASDLVVNCRMLDENLKSYV